MPRIPCRICKNCGLYNDISVNTCECGSDLSSLPAQVVEEEIPLEHYGEINEHLQVYVQKCSACGAENYTLDLNKPAKICFNCHKARIATIAPVLLIEETTLVDEISTGTDRNELVSSEKTANYIDKHDEEDDDDDDADNESSLWASILGNVQSATGYLQSQNCAESSYTAEHKKAVDSVPNSSISPSYDDGSEDDDDDAEKDWSALLGGTSSQSRQISKETEITLTAIRFGRLSVTLKSSQQGLPFLLGRSAQLSDFLCQDMRVGNEHCYIDFRSGKWYVIDNHSANGTAVNRRFLDVNGEHILNDGDELTLGHHPDSMAFRINIR